MQHRDRTILTRRQIMAGGAAMAVLAIGARAQGASAGWRAAPSLPMAVQEIYPAVQGGRIHLAGGLFAEGGQIAGATARHVAWSPGEAAWRDLAPLPSARHHPNLVGAGGRVLSLGGFTTREGAVDWTMTDETLAYDPATDEWQAGPAAPEPHGETVCVATGGQVHVIGGRSPRGESNMSWNDHADTDRHLVLDVDSGQWQRAAPAPTKRNSAAGALLNGAIHVVGGRVVNGANLTAHEVWDESEDRWRSATPMPDVTGGGQGGLAAAVIGGQLVALGGEYFADGGGVYPNVWIYDPQTDRWQAGPDMMTPRHGLGAAALGDTLYAIGGATRAGGNGTSAAVEALVL